VSATPLDERIRKWVKLETLREMQSGAAKASSMHPRPNLSSQYIEPRTPTEQKLAAIWQNLLGVAPIGIYDKFFELGGHSLLAIQLISTVRETFQVEVPPQRLFEAPTIAAFAASIEADIAASKQMAEQQEQEQMAELLSLVEGLSDEEVAALLADPEQLAAKLASNG
jgi:acyl carrier protein